MVSTAEKLCQFFPEPFQKFTEFVTSMRFEEEPKYDACIALFEPIIGGPAERPILIEGNLNVSHSSSAFSYTSQNVWSGCFKHVERVLKYLLQEDTAVYFRVKRTWKQIERVSSSESVTLLNACGQPSVNQFRVQSLQSPVSCRGCSRELPCWTRFQQIWVKMPDRKGWACFGARPYIKANCIMSCHNVKWHRVQVT